jgi:hypothetical protein
MPLIASEILDVYSITDGLNTIKSGVRIGPTELKNCQNIRFRPVGGFRWRQGYSTLGNQPNAAATGLYMARFSTPTNVAFRTQGTKIEKMDNLDGTWDDITGAVSLTSGQNRLFSFAILNDIVIAVNGTDNAVQINSSLTASTVGALPGSAIPTFVYEHRGYMWYITSNAAFFSDLNTPATVGANNFIRVGGKNGGEHVGGVDFQGRNYVFKRHAIHAVEFQPTQVNSSGDLFPFIEIANPVVPGVGTQSPHSIVKFTLPATNTKESGRELVFFVDQFGVPRIFDGESSVAIGTNILTSRDETITSLEDMERTRLPYVWAVNDASNNLIYCFMTSEGGTQHDVCWVLDYTTSFAWSRDSYAKSFNCGAIFETTDGIFKPYFADYNGQVYEMDRGQTDNGTAIHSYARSGDLFVKSPVVQSKWTYNEVRGSAGSDTQTVQVDYFINGEDTSSGTVPITLFKENQANWDEVNWDEFSWVYSGLTTKSSEVNLEAKTLGVQFSNQTSGNTVTIEGYSLFVIPEGWKQES